MNKRRKDTAKGEDDTHTQDRVQSAFLFHVLGVRATKKVPVLKVGSKPVSLDFIHHDQSSTNQREKFKPSSNASKEEEHISNTNKNKNKARSMIQQLRQPSSSKPFHSSEDDIVCSPFANSPFSKKRRVLHEEVERRLNPYKIKKEPPSPKLIRRKFDAPSPIKPFPDEDHTSAFSLDIFNRRLKTNNSSEDETQNSPLTAHKYGKNVDEKENEMEKVKSKEKEKEQEKEELDETVLNTDIHKKNNCNKNPENNNEQSNNNNAHTNVFPVQQNTRFGIQLEEYADSFMISLEQFMQEHNY